MTALALYQPAQLDAVQDFIGKVARTAFVPSAFQGKPEAILAAVMYGAEIGLAPMQSLQLIDVIQGRPSLSAEGMRGLVLQAGHRIWPSKLGNEQVVLNGCRKGADDVVTVSWSLDDAKRAGLKGDNWSKYPRAMLLARATSELCRTLFADVIGGLSYVPEEIESFSPPPNGKVAEIEQPALPPADPDTGEIIDTNGVDIGAKAAEVARRSTVRKPPGQKPPPEVSPERAALEALIARVKSLGDAALMSAQADWSDAGLPKGGAATLDAAQTAVAAGIMQAVIDAAEAPFDDGSGETT